MTDAASWYDKLEHRQSLGRQTAKTGTLAGLHVDRRRHLGQFYTPTALARFVWQLAEPAMNAALSRAPGSFINVLDNSVGSGRLLQFAQPDRHALHGLDVHADSIDDLAEATAAAGFHRKFQAGAMETVQLTGYGVALINPPFSLPLKSPFMQPFSCTAHGPFGPNTSALSHEYALCQALEAADLVVAILPVSMCSRLARLTEAKGRLRALFLLPAQVFQEEAGNVQTLVAVFGDRRHDAPAPLVQRLKALPQQAPALDLRCRNSAEGRASAAWVINHIEPSQPVVTLPVTHDRRVRICHDGRRLVLKFACGLTQAKVMNQVLAFQLGPYTPMSGDRQRYPKGFRYGGQGRLDLETHLLQDDPLASLDALAAHIGAAGGLAVLDPGTRRHLQRRARRLAVETTPFKHWVWRQHGTAGHGASVLGTAKRRHLIDPLRWGSPLIEAGAELAFSRVAGDRFQYVWQGQTYELDEKTLNERFTITTGAHQEGWELVHPGRIAAFPALAQPLLLRARRLGLDRFLNWDYQLEDAVELSMTRGAVCAWTMGLGKARLAIALCLLNEGRHNLIVVEPHLVPEMVEELQKLGIADDSWQVITHPRQLEMLRALNIISYHRLRSPIDPRHPRRTYASRLRRRITTLVADEGHLLRNNDTQQSRALWAISAKRRYILTGTPCASYPRDVHALTVFTCGDGTAAQPWGWHRSHLQARHVDSLLFAQRGIDAFREQFITLVWAVNEFKEDNRNGAKREIPKIAHLDAYRAMLAPVIKRRLMGEPEVARFVNIPKAEVKRVRLAWDEDHLHHYLTVAEEFMEWFSREKREAYANGRNLNLVAVLARIQALQYACTYPQRPSETRPSFGLLTSKQRYALDRLQEWTSEGHKTVVYVKSPGHVELLARELHKRGIASVAFHGGRPIAQRTREMKTDFRRGAVPILLATLDCTQTGLNIPEADRFLFLEHAWNSKDEVQAMARLLRPQQKNQVYGEFLELEGSIDVYMSQMVDFKAEAADAGIDWGEESLQADEFQHFDTLLGRFCEATAKLLGCKQHQLRAALACRAA